MDSSESKEESNGEVSDGTGEGREDISDGEIRDFVSSLQPLGEGKKRSEFKEEILRDDSLNSWRELADRKERGFKWRDGVLVLSKFVCWEQFRDVVVVPKSYRKRVLVVAHERLGHLGGEKTLGMINKYFVWPGMSKDVFAHCRGCEQCQMKSRYVPRKAPTVDRPLLTEPFESVAFDLVGPLPKGKGGCMYLLTYVCMATRWPEAIPLRAITARSVAEGLWNIFARTSIPEIILTDQGSQFCSRLVKELCELVQIQKVRTSPYHPQTNGCIERMHSTFKSVLGKCIEEKKDWVAQVPFVLFVLRQMPHSDLGFSPFDLVYGFRVRTPLYAMYHGIYKCRVEDLNVCEWVEGMAERLQLLKDCAALNMAKSKEKRKIQMDKGCKLREFKEGEKVLYRIPGLCSKLSDSWEGPYVVGERMGSVNYKIYREGRRRVLRSFMSIA